MPWGRSRTAKPASLVKQSRRNSYVDTSIDRPSPVESTASAHTAPSTHENDPLRTNKSPSPLRQSFDPQCINHVATRKIDDGFLHADSVPLQRPHRFSMLAKRHVSDPQLSRTAREQNQFLAPPLPINPSITTTGPANSSISSRRVRSRPSLTLLSQKSAGLLNRKTSQQSLSHQSSQIASPVNGPPLLHTQPDVPAQPIQQDPIKGLQAPPPYGEESARGFPVARLSESSRSDASYGDHIFASTTTQTISTTTTFFRLPRRRRKEKGSLFPLPAKVSSEGHSPPGLSPRVSTTSGRPSDISRQHSPSRSSPLLTVQSASSENRPQNLKISTSRPGSRIAFSHIDSSRATPSASMTNSARPSAQIQRDETLFGYSPLTNSARTSTSTSRASLGGLINMSRMRPNSESSHLRQHSGQPQTPGTPISAVSKSQSLTIPRESIIVPERLDGETPAKYLARLEESVRRGRVAIVLSQINDDFFKNVLRSYMRGFKFFGDPLDMSTRKLLMEVELPKETQQIDRVLQAFANRYHECNPGIFAAPDEAYFIAFSILILHTDVFNKNNKSKMQRADYTKNARGQGVADEILECFYDNIAYTPFIHVDDLDVNGERPFGGKPRKGLFSKQSNDATLRISKEPVDPYTLIIDGHLEMLRPSLKDVMNLEEYYSYQGTSPLTYSALHHSFCRYGILQILSSRSRPEAFNSPEPMANPAIIADSHPGVVDINVTKIGILWRKHAKKKKTRSPWQEWGAILTSAQLYLFRNAAWAKTLMAQYDHHARHSKPSNVVFKPPLEQFKPDVLMSTEDAVALRDFTYRKHKNAFVFVRHGGLEEVFLADSETEMNDWLGKINFATAFRTANIRIRGPSSIPSDPKLDRGDETEKAREENSTLEIKPPPRNGSLTEIALNQQIRQARRELIARKISEADMRLKDLCKMLERQLRNARHLQLLAPIQNKTREQLVLAAGSMAAKIKWSRIDIWRTRCHRDLWAADLEDDLREGIPNHSLEGAGKTGPIPTKLDSNDSGRIELGQYAWDRANTRPVTQPSPTKSLRLDSIFASFQRTSGIVQHHSKDPWELPPLSFQQGRSSLKSQTGQSTHDVPAPVPATDDCPTSHLHSHSVEMVDDSQLLRTPRLSPIVSKDQKMSPALDDLTKKASLEGLKRASTAPSKEIGQQQAHTIETDSTVAADNKARLRRSLQRTLRDPNSLSTHHSRNKRGRDSASGLTLMNSSPAAGSASLDLNSPMGQTSSGSVGINADNQTLTRSPGSFNFHGKKASVITFGTDWKAIKPDERGHNQGSELRDHSSLLATVQSEEQCGRDESGLSEDFGRILQARLRENARRDSIISATDTAVTDDESYQDAEQEQGGEPTVESIDGEEIRQQTESAGPL